jgi:hypothetical protein
MPEVRSLLGDTVDPSVLVLHLGASGVLASSTGRCNGPAMMAGSSRTNDQWRSHHVRQNVRSCRSGIPGPAESGGVTRVS